MATVDLVAKHTKLSAEINRLKGQRETYLKRLKDEFSVETPEQAKALLKELTDRKEALQAEYQKAHTEFMEKYGDAIAAI